MKKYSQRDPKYGDILLGFSKTSKIKNFGCKLVSFSMIDGENPKSLNEKFKQDKCFFNGDLLSDEACAKSLGWKFIKKTTVAPKKGVCIAEVDMSPSPGMQQHFVVYRPSKGVIVDPWTGTERPKNTYPFISFRIFEYPDTSSEKEKDTVEAPVASQEVPRTNETEKVVPTYQTEDKPSKIEAYDTGTRGHAGDGNFRPRIEDASAGTRNTDVEEPNATGISVSANTVVTSVPTLNPQSKLEKFVNWFLQKWDKYKKP